MSLNQLLIDTGIEHDKYLQAVSISNVSNVIVLKHEPNECKINNYNGPVLQAWQANMDLQCVLNAFVCVMYVASYMMKTERQIGELLKRVASEVRSEELTTQLRIVGAAFLNHREVSAQEAVYRMLSVPMKQLRRSVVFVDTNSKHECVAVLKNAAAIDNLMMMIMMMTLDK